MDVNGKEIDAIIFDKDGTLFDFNATWGVWAMTMFARESDGDPQRLQALADALGYDLAARQFLPGSIVIAETVDVLADHILPHIKDPDKAALIARMNTAASQVPQVESAPLRAFFETLKTRGLRVGVATNDSEAPARAHLDRAGVTGCSILLRARTADLGGNRRRATAGVL